jgi:alpha-glucosidase (family GH31 glycosyl hydrolase)
MDKLHQMGKRITLNLHPADGVRAFEEAYLPMAKELGVDYESEEKIPFDVTDRAYMQAYFKYLHHPHEKDGVDFWWVDWQQGSVSRTKGVDPLWMLNHLHFMDSGRDGKLPLTFSRYAGVGSHRYPVGFSGDTYSTWESLQFQPYFTANASNVGYTWWSHDIGGHMMGRKDDELVARWIQFGVFSPIMRLHSTSNEFYGKEPWNYNMIAEKVISDFMRLRHKLVPYLHTWNYKTHLEGLPLVQPMYYRHDEREAYNVPNEYYFGDVIVCPVTQPADRETGLAEVDAWIPEGTYIDFFTGQVYRGKGRKLLYRDMSSIPVLVPAGTIIPMAADYATSCIKNPEHLEVLVFNGANGSFKMYEDDCSEMTGMEPVITEFSFKAGKDATLSMKVAEGSEGVIPAKRSYCMSIRGIRQLKSVEYHVDGQKISVETDYDQKLQEVILSVKGEAIKGFTFNMKCDGEVSQSDRKEVIRELLHRAQIEYDIKEKIYHIIKEEDDVCRVCARLQALKLKNELFGAIIEQLTSEY